MNEPMPVFILSLGHQLDMLKDMLKAIQESELQWVDQKATMRDVVRRLEENCRKLGLEVHGQTPTDGNCFFHAGSDQLDLLGLQPMSAAEFRQAVVNFMIDNPVLQVTMSVRAFCGPPAMLEGPHFGCHPVCMDLCTYEGHSICFET